MAARHEWKHNWIPLTPAAALIKAKGSKTTAAKLRAKHGVKSSSTRDVVRASRQTSIGDHGRPQTKQASTGNEALDRLRAQSNAAAEKHGLPFRAGDEVTLVGLGGGRQKGTVHGISTDGHYADVIYGKESMPRRVSVVYVEKDGKRVAGTKTTEDLLRDADARRTKPLDLTARRQAEQAAAHPIGATVDARQPGIDKVTRGKIVGRDRIGMLDVEYTDRNGKTVVGRFNPSHTTVVEKPTDDLAAARARRASEQSARAAELRGRAAAERGKLQGIADRSGLQTTDPQANRLNARGLRQAHRNTDSSLRRYTETQQRANALESKAHLAEARAKEAGRTRLTRADVEGATHIVDQHGQPREVVRVNAKTVTVKTPYSWTETVPIEKIRRVVKATPEQIAAAKARVARGAEAARSQVTAAVVRSVKVSPTDIKPGEMVVSSGNNGRGAGFAARLERTEKLPDGSTRLHFRGGQTMTVQPGEKVTVERETGETVPVRKRTSKVDEAREKFGNGSREHLAALAVQGRKRR